MKAIINGQTIAESDDTIMIEGNHYFPPDSVRQEHLSDGSRQYTCPWKGEAKYWDVKAGDQVEPNAAWSYPEPMESAQKIVGHDFSDYVAFHVPPAEVNK